MSISHRIRSIFPILRRLFVPMLMILFLLPALTASAQTPASESIEATESEQTNDNGIFASDRKVTGTVVDSQGNPIKDVAVESYFDNGLGNGLARSTTTDQNGAFTIDIDNELAHHLYFNPVGDRFFSEYYDGKAEITDADPLTVEPGQVVSITVMLSRTHTISGTVLDVLGVPIKNISVDVQRRDYDWWSTMVETTTDENGNYVADFLKHGEYRIEFRGQRYIREFYNDQTQVEDADILSLFGDGEVVIADVVLDRYGLITGTVSDIYGTPLNDVGVSPYYEQDDEWNRGLWTHTDENGNYRLFATYPYPNVRVGLNQEYGFDYVDEYYDDMATVQAAHTFSLPVNSVIPNIDFVWRRINEVEADFVGTPVTGTHPLTVTFTDQSKDVVTSRTWNFGDGATSTAISPTHTYTSTGYYTVTLTVVGAENRHTKTKASYIEVFDTPITDLEIEQGNAGGGLETPSLVGQTLHFSATSGGTNVQYLWDFGDEEPSVATTATGQYVQHAYATAGTYIVTLTASNGFGEEVATSTITVQYGLHLPKLEH